MAFWFLVLVPVGVWAPSGCEGIGTGATSGLPVAGEVRDSAGVTIVEHRALPEDLPEWAIAPEPELSIGALDGEGPEAFSRVTGLTVRSDGVILALDQAGMELRAFDAEGRHLWSTGRAGEGPGEFRLPAAVSTFPADSAVVVDVLASQALVFDPDGRYVRAVPMRAIRDGLGAPSFRGVTASGILVVTAVEASRAAAPGAGAQRSSSVLAYLDADGRVVIDSERRFPGQARESRVMGVTGPDGTPTTARVITRMQMGPETVFAPTAAGVVVGTQDTFEILWYDQGARLLRILRVASEPMSVDRARYVNHGVEEIDDPERRRALREQREGALVAETLPAFDRVVADAADRVWIQEFVPVYDAREPVWWIVDAAGAFVATASLPPRFIPHVIMADRVIGLRQDDFDVPHVEVRSIVR